MQHVSARMTILELLLTATKGLVDLPDHVSVEYEVSDDITLYKIDLHKDDHPNFLGRAGTHMRCLRTLADSIAKKADMKVVLLLCE